MNVTADCLLKQIAECEFTCCDINLYLDTHPDDSRAIADYNCYCEQLRALKDLYCSKFGPLENFGNSPYEVGNEWVHSSWPWCRKRMEA